MAKKMSVEQRLAEIENRMSKLERVEEEDVGALDARLDSVENRINRLESVEELDEKEGVEVPEEGPWVIREGDYNCYLSTATTSGIALAWTREIDNAIQFDSFQEAKEMHRFLEPLNNNTYFVIRHSLAVLQKEDPDAEEDSEEDSQEGFVICAVVQCKKGQNKLYWYQCPDNVKGISEWKDTILRASVFTSSQAAQDVLHSDVPAPKGLVNYLILPTE